MRNLHLKALDITNFRSIRGHIHAPLDAKVVLIHGENGAGKTSLLSAIELALTGGVQSLRRADPGYARQLLHRSTAQGSVSVITNADFGDASYTALLDANGVKSVNALEQNLATFFGERTYLPQALLGQLLQIYQDSGSGAESPLAKFVGDLLGLDRLDALEAGLKPLADVRNVRKVVDGWSQIEIEKNRLDRLMDDQRRLGVEVARKLKNALEELATICEQLKIPVDVSEESLEEIATAFLRKDEEAVLDRLMDQRRRLGSIQRELAGSDWSLTQVENLSQTAAAEASSAFALWENANGARIARLRNSIAALFPLSPLPGDFVGFGEEALKLLRSEHKIFAGRADQARSDLKRLSKASGELDVAKQQRATIDEEVSRIPSGASSLGAVLSEISSFIDGDICPVCERDFKELNNGVLADHVHDRVHRLSASATRLLSLARLRSEQQSIVERLEREIEALEARVLNGTDLANMDRQTGTLDAEIAEVEAMNATVNEGAKLRATEVAMLRLISEAQSRSVALAAARETLSEFAMGLGITSVTENETFQNAASRLEEIFTDESKRLEGRVALRRRGDDLVSTIKPEMARRTEIKTAIFNYMQAWQRADRALQRAQLLREQGISVRNAVDEVRSGIIRNEFNDRLNRVWRDLFVRLAPGEPFVPAFRVPASSTQKLQPKLITEHRHGGESGGTPGSMLSAGNLNTAALTLFIAMHLAVPNALPWLILDDPVQSMDDVHISQFAALLRTLSKEHDRQIMIAVHDRQLFEYLRLELSPAFANDSLLTLELSRSARRDTLCFSRRLQFQEETSLRLVA
jgi:DNA repair protein SbcC/Rad50